jgi:polyphosphate kinase
MRKGTKKGNNYKEINREISWLSFNERVLQEAQDKSVPLVQRIRFLGIFSNNRDEFHKVRVATVQRMAALPKKDKAKLPYNPDELLEQIKEIGLYQDRSFQNTFKKLVKELESESIYMLDESKLSKEQKLFVSEQFEEKVRGSLVPINIDNREYLPEVKDNTIYFAVLCEQNGKKAQKFIIEIPAKEIGRFVVLPTSDKKKNLILIDDLIRFNLKSIFKIFEFDKISAYTFKVIRDAELDIEDDISESWMEKLSKSIKNRKDGDPVRFVHDKNMPKVLLNAILKRLEISSNKNIIASGRYHNFRDFMSFPDFGMKKLVYEKLPPLPHPRLKKAISVLNEIKKRDILLSYPYQSFQHLIDLLREAAIDPNVRKIKINLYRVAKNSRVINALINAVSNGKEVSVIVELTARFDEKNNIKVSEKLSEAGCQVIHGVQGLKVHSKLILIERVVRNKKQLYAHIGTGNFHEGTAQIYGDYSYLTANDDLCQEVEKVFEFFEANYKRFTYRKLLVSPFNSRRRLMLLMTNEIRNAKKGLRAEITLKMNNLVDEGLVKKLYEASQAGVKIRMIIRGICSLIPGVKGLSENIEIYSIVDRFLEHARVMIFHNAGDEIVLIGSADWMTRNIDHRIEVLCPVLDESIQKQLKEHLEIQFNGNVKARVLNRTLNNKYRKQEGDVFHSQMKTYEYFKKLTKA